MCVCPCLCVSVCVCVSACMLVCPWHTELKCIRDVWPSGHYGSGPQSCVSVCVSVCMCRCTHTCVHVVYRADVYTECMA